MTRIKKISLVIAGTLILAGCSAVDDAINDAVNDTLSGDVDTDTIKAKEKVLILNNVNRTACVAIKNSLAENGNRKNAETLVTELGVTCATYGKTAGDPLEVENDTECVEESLSEWLDEESNGNITDLEKAQGDKACVIGFDL